MQVIATAITDVKIIRPQSFGDERGFFYENFNQQRFEEAVGRQVTFVQDNHSRSTCGVLRGLPALPESHLKLAATSGRTLRIICHI